MTNRLNWRDANAVTHAAMSMHLVVRGVSGKEAAAVIRRCVKDVRAYMPHPNPTRLQVKVAVKMYFEHLGRLTMPLPEEVQAFHAENGSL